MKVTVKKDEVVVLVQEWLRSNGFLETMQSLERESRVTSVKYGREQQFLRQKILAGAFDQATEFLSTFRASPALDWDRAQFLLTRQSFLEAAYARDDDAKAAIMAELSRYEHKCSREEYGALCYIMQLPALTDHADFYDWTPQQGRLDTFVAISEGMDHLFPPSGHQRLLEMMAPGRLDDLLRMAVLHQLTSFRAQHPEVELPSTLEFSLLTDLGGPDDMALHKTLSEHVDGLKKAPEEDVLLAKDYDIVDDPKPFSTAWNIP